LLGRAAKLAALKSQLFLEKCLALVRPYEDAEVLRHLSRPIAVVASSSGYVVRRVLEAAGLASSAATPSWRHLVASQGVHVFVGSSDPCATVGQLRDASPHSVTLSIEIDM